MSKITALLAALAVTLCASSAHAAWTNVWQEGWSGTATTGRTVTGIGSGGFTRFRQAFLFLPDAALANDVSPVINFTSSEGTVLCIDTDDVALAAQGTAVVNVYWLFGPNGDTTAGDGAVLAQNSGGNVALSSGAPCETFAAGYYLVIVNTPPDGEDAVLHAYSN